MEELIGIETVDVIFGITSMVLSGYLLKQNKKQAIIFAMLGLVFIFPIVVASQLQLRKQKPTLVSWVIRIIPIILLGTFVIFITTTEAIHPLSQFLAGIIGFLAEQPIFFNNGIIETPEFRFQLSISWSMVMSHALLGFVFGTLLFNNWVFYSFILGSLGGFLGVMIDARILVYSAVEVMKFASETNYEQYAMEYTKLTFLVLLLITIIFSRLRNQTEMFKAK